MRKMLHCIGAARERHRAGPGHRSPERQGSTIDGPDRPSLHDLPARGAFGVTGFCCPGALVCGVRLNDLRAR